MLTAFIILGGISVYSLHVGREPYRAPVRGICYFDIDRTLTTARDGDQIIRECLSRGYDVGIVTASSRRRFHVCRNGVQTEPWMPPILCQMLDASHGALYNSTTELGGSTALPSAYLQGNTVGGAKAYAMTACRDRVYPHLPDSSLILFDNDPIVLRQVARANPNVRLVCANVECGAPHGLTPAMVAHALESM